MIDGSNLADRARDVRAFNRFYTNHIGLLEEHLVGGGLSLTQVRVLYEIGDRDGTSAGVLASHLRLDAGYLSRVLAGLKKRGLIVGAPSLDDRRRIELRLSAIGRETLDALRATTQRQIEDMLAPLGPERRSRLVLALRTVRDILEDDAASDARDTPIVLRPHGIGDIGHVISRHGMLYAREYGWDGSFEALVAQIGADFLRDFDPVREICWIAERGEDIVGSAFVVRQDDGVAKLRMVYVEPSARGLGIGKRLLSESLRFARDRGYSKMVLWTNAGLDAARGLYEAAGFRLIAEEPHHSFGKDLVGQNWELDL